MGCYRFGEFQLDLDAFALRRGDQVVQLQPKVLDVLRYLVEHRGRMVTKKELLDELWHDEYVNEAVVSWSVSHIRRALGQLRRDKQPIETVHGRGYRFSAEVTSTEAPAASSRRRDASQPERPALVGRARVLDELSHHVQEAAAGRGGLCVITGEAGIGKTRIIDELVKVAPTMGVLPITGRCPQEPAAPPFWPIAAALGGVSSEHPEIAQRARELLSGAAGNGTRGEEDTRTSSEGTRFWLIEQAAQLLRDLVALRPALLVVDDLHWADANSVRLLSFIAPELRDIGLCIALTLRGSDRGRDGGSRRMLQLMRHAHHIPLGSLDATQVAELVEVLSQQRPTPDLAEAIRRAAGGVPLFVQEVVRSLALEHGERALGELPPQAVGVPDLARDLLRERVQRLPETVTEVLSLAAVIGESFDLSLLAALTELEPESLLERLEPALEEGQLVSEAPHTFRFVHSLFRSVLYDELPPTQRVSTHRAIGRLLETRAGLEPRLGEIARRYYLSLPAGDHDAVVQRARVAGDAAMRTYAFEDAIRYFKWALEAQAFGETVEPLARGNLMLSLAAAQRSAGRTQQAMETSRRLIELAVQHQLHDVLVRATRLRRPTVAMAMVPDSLTRSALETVLQEVKDSNAPVRASALSQLACLPPYERDLSRSKALSARALALAEQLGDEDVGFEAMRARLFALSGPDDIDAVLELAGSMLASPGLVPPGRHRADARSARFTAYLLAGRVAEADATLDEMTSSLPGPNWPEATFYCERLRAQRRFLDGHFEEAKERWQVIHKQASRAGVTYADFFHGMQTLHLAIEREGPKSEFSKRIRRSMAKVPNAARTYHAGLLRFAAQAGETSFVKGQLPQLGDPSDYPRDAGYLHLLASFATCAAAVDDRTRCEQLLELLGPYESLNTPDSSGFYLGSVSYFLGLLAVTLDRPAAADGYFEHALSHNRAMGYRAGVVRTLAEHAKLCAAAGRGPAAREFFQAAREHARALGMTAAAEDAERALS